MELLLVLLFGHEDFSEASVVERTHPCLFQHPPFLPSTLLPSSLPKGNETPYSMLQEWGDPTVIRTQHSPFIQTSQLRCNTHAQKSSLSSLLINPEYSHCHGLTCFFSLQWIYIVGSKSMLDLL